MSELINKLEKLKDSLKGSQIGGQTYGQIFGINRNTPINQYHSIRCSICGKQQYSSYTLPNGTLCRHCSNKKTAGIVGISKSTVDNKIDALIAEEEKKIKFSNYISLEQWKLRPQKIFTNLIILI